MKTKTGFLKYGLIAVVLIALIGSGYIFVGSMTYSEGERTGVITKFSHKGLINKTWEGELLINVPGAATTEKWLFSVSDPEVVDEIQNAQREGGRYTLHYEQQMFKQSWKGGTSYFVVRSEKQQ